MAIVITANRTNTNNNTAPQRKAQTDGIPDKNYSDVEANQQMLTEEQKKAAEAFQKKQREIQEKREQEAEKSMLEKELENADKQADAIGDSIETFSKCMKIASRIAKGDIVPPKDIKYLAEHEPDLYKQAIIMRVPNDKPKKHKSLVEDEDEKADSTSDSGETGEASSGESAEVCEAPEADGEAVDAADAAD